MNETAPIALTRLLIVSHVVHYEHGGRLFAYGPYAREIDIWADLFSEVVIAAPRRREPPPADCLPFGRANIAMAPQLETGGESRWSKAVQLAAVPYLVATLACAMRRADAIHVRCPGNLGLLGAALAPLFSRYRVAKYAGQWNGYAGELWTVRLQRRILRSAWWSSPVTVYGDWDRQPAHVVPFFTSMMTAAQQAHAARVAARKSIGVPLRVLFSGSLTRRKRVDVLLDAVRLVNEQGVALDVAIVGHGPDRGALERQAAALGLNRVVRFVGGLPFDDSLAWYEWAHCLVLPSTHSEGWPKVVAEAMSHGLVCVAVDHGQVASMMKDRGLLLSTGSAQEIAQALVRIARHPSSFAHMTRNAARWAGRYSLEGLREALLDLLVAQWGLDRRSLVA